MVDLLLLLLVLFLDLELHVLDLFLAPFLDQLILLHELSLIITSGLSHDCLKLHLTLWVQQFLLSISEALDEVRQHFNIDDTLIWNKNESPSLKMVWPDEFKSCGLKKPSPTELINIFTSTTNYHEYYKKKFSKVVDGQYLDMIDWLSDKDDALSDQEVWSFSAASYSFKYLRK